MYMYLQKVITEKLFFKLPRSFLLASWRSMTKIAGSGSESGFISQRHRIQIHTKMSWIRNTGKQRMWGKTNQSQQSEREWTTQYTLKNTKETNKHKHKHKTNLKVVSGPDQTCMRVEWYHWIGPWKDINRYRFEFFYLDKINTKMPPISPFFGRRLV